MTINEFMTSDHRSCDEQFAEVENSVDSGNIEAAKAMFEEFHAHMLKHFQMEEEVMFVEYNNSGAGGCNPTGVMVMEHDQMKTLMAQMADALMESNKERFLGLSENLLFVMQQHNMKEEQIMYGLADSSLNSDAIIEKMKAL
jgi:DUF438 domain-containing protein